MHGRSERHARDEHHLRVLGTVGQLHTSSAAHWRCTACRGGVTAEIAAPQSPQHGAAWQQKMNGSSAALA